MDRAEAVRVVHLEEGLLNVAPATRTIQGLNKVRPCRSKFRAQTSASCIAYDRSGAHRPLIGACWRIRESVTVLSIGATLSPDICPARNQKP